MHSFWNTVWTYWAKGALWSFRLPKLIPIAIVCDFALVVSGNLGPIVYCFGDVATKTREIAGFSHLSLTEGPRSDWSHWVCGVSEWNLVTKSYNPWAYNDSDNCVFLYSISEKIQGSLILHLKAHSYCQLQKKVIYGRVTRLLTRHAG